VATIERFEDLKSWIKARQLANIVHELVNHPKFARDYKLRDQIDSASGSVMHNIAEGFDSGSDPEFIRFLKMARRSASEVQSELYLALDRQYISREELRCTYEMATEVKRLINGLIAYLRQTKQPYKKIGESLSLPYDSDGFDPEASDMPDNKANDYKTNDYQTKDY
jgi:four helix bundle protein